MKILLVEDNPGDARLLREQLRDAPRLATEISEAGRLDAALQLLAERPMDVVLLDLSLPDANGLEAVSRIHAVAAAVPIVVLTGLDDEELALRAVEVGAQDYLVKGRVDGPVLVRAMGYAIQRSRAEQATRQLTQEQAARAVAETGERRFRDLAEAIPQIVWEADVSGRHLYLSPRFYEYSGQDPSEQREHPWRAVIHPEDLPLCQEAWSTAQRISSAWEMQYRLRAADGSYRWHLGQSVPSLDGAGKVVRWYGTATDIDAQKRADEERAVLLEREKRERELREQFLAIVGHDLRNPLMSVALGADLLLDGTEPVSRGQATVLRRITQSTTRMTKLIDQLMDFARARAGTELPIELADTSLNEVCQEVAEECAMASSDGDIRIEAEGEVRGQWDSDRLEEVVSNLIGNALQHGAGSPVTVKLSRAESGAVLQVHNEGEPIPEAILPHVFDPFRRGPSRKKSSSIGLGLFITQQIVLAHQGMVEVSSSKHEGTTFTVTLPFQPHTDQASGEAG